MTTISMYTASVPQLVRSLTNLATILEKGAAHAEARKLDPAVLVQFRLYPDMFALAKQVQIATDVAKAGGSRLAGLDPPVFEDNETTFEQLIARVRRTIAHLESFTPAQIDGSEDRSVTLQTRAGPRPLVGLQYLLGFVLPNVYFHVTTTYNILRHNGVELGKADYMGV